MPEFSQRVLEALRPPRENGNVIISRGTPGSSLLYGPRAASLAR